MTTFEAFERLRAAFRALAREFALVLAPDLRRTLPPIEDSTRAPHCDPSILHAPGECEFCDLHPSRQVEREIQRINFTGQHDPERAPCPSEFFRSPTDRDAWGRNRPSRKGPE